MITKHTCGGPVFGQKTPGCPRCDELLAGSAPRTQPWRARYARQAEIDRKARERHFAPGGPHATGKCGLVCTAFDW